MSGWRWNRRVATTIVATVLTVQLALPVGVFLLREGDFAGRFGWQMYAVAPQATEFTVHTADGPVTVTAGRYMAVPRSDLPIAELLPPHLCQVVPGAQRITWDGGGLQC